MRFEVVVHDAADPVAAASSLGSSTGVVVAPRSARCAQQRGCAYQRVEVAEVEQELAIGESQDRPQLQLEHGWSSRRRATVLRCRHAAGCVSGDFLPVVWHARAANPSNAIRQVLIGLRNLEFHSQPHA